MKNCCVVSWMKAPLNLEPRPDLAVFTPQEIHCRSQIQSLTSRYKSFLNNQ